MGCLALRRPTDGITYDVQLREPSRQESVLWSCRDLLLTGDTNSLGVIVPIVFGLNLGLLRRSLSLCQALLKFDGDFLELSGDLARVLSQLRQLLGPQEERRGDEDDADLGRSQPEEGHRLDLRDGASLALQRGGHRLRAGRRRGRVDYAGAADARDADPEVGRGERGRAREDRKDEEEGRGKSVHFALFGDVE